MQFSNILKQVRKNKNITQFQLAEILNVSDKTVSSWENGRSYPDIFMLKSIATALEINANVLLDSEEFKTDINHPSEEETLKNIESEKRFIKNENIAIALYGIPLFIPIFIFILNGVLYMPDNQDGIVQIPEYDQYLETFRLSILILTVIAFIDIIVSLTFCINAAITFKKDVIDKNNDNRSKSIYFRYLNAYAAISTLILQIDILIMLKNLPLVFSCVFVLTSIYIISNLFIRRKLNYTQRYNKASFYSFAFLSIFLIAIIAFLIEQSYLLSFFLFLGFYGCLVLFLVQKDEKIKIQ